MRPSFHDRSALTSDLAQSFVLSRLAMQRTRHLLPKGEGLFFPLPPAVPFREMRHWGAPFGWATSSGRSSAWVTDGWRVPAPWRSGVGDEVRDLLGAELPGSSRKRLRAFGGRACAASVNHPGRARPFPVAERIRSRKQSALSRKETVRLPLREALSQDLLERQKSFMHPWAV